MKKQFIVLTAILFSAFASAQLVIPLWETGKMPNSKALPMNANI